MKDSNENMSDVNYIWRGPAAGDSGNLRKNLACQTRHKSVGLEINLTNQFQGSMVHDIPIIFSEDDARIVHHPYCDALVVTLYVANKCLHRILIEIESSADILFLSIFARMGLEISQLKPYTTPVHRFIGGSIVPEGVIGFTMSFEKSPTKVTTIVNSIIVDQPSSYNDVLRSLTLYTIKAITLIYHYAFKFPTKAELCEEGKRKRESIMR